MGAQWHAAAHAPAHRWLPLASRGAAGPWRRLRLRTVCASTRGTGAGILARRSLRSVALRAAGAPPPGPNAWAVAQLPGFRVLWDADNVAYRSAEWQRIREYMAPAAHTSLDVFAGRTAAKQLVGGIDTVQRPQGVAPSVATGRARFVCMTSTRLCA